LYAAVKKPITAILLFYEKFFDNELSQIANEIPYGMTCWRDVVPKTFTEDGKMKDILCRITGFIFSICILASALFAQPTEIIAIKCGKLIDGKSDRALDNQTILIQNNRITAVGATVQIPANAKVIIAFGSDLTGAHGTNAREIEVMVRYGMAPMAAIKSATTVAAELMGWQNNIGSLEAGKLADIIAVSGNPLADITELQRAKFVMKDGKVSKNAF
jgi:imidazolonepropionase-like amidohydrolase